MEANKWGLVAAALAANDSDDLSASSDVGSLAVGLLVGREVPGLFIADGMVVDLIDGWSEGERDVVGLIVGWPEGATDAGVIAGAIVESLDGVLLDLKEGIEEGFMDGMDDGGAVEGEALGIVVGSDDGIREGLALATGVGPLLGLVDGWGDVDGCIVGGLVGTR